MSLLDDGPDVVSVFVEVSTTDEYGNAIWVPADTATTVRGRVQPSTAEESTQLGQQTSTVYRFLSRSFPGGPYARVEWDGRSWDVHGEPKRHGGSTSTTHVTTWLKER